MTATADISSRFVMAPDAPYVRNLAALWALDPDLARAIESISELPYQIEPTKSGEVTLRIPQPARNACAEPPSSQTSVYLHSKFAPSTEAEKLISSTPTDEKFAFAVFGFALGYHVEKLFDRISHEAKIIVFEPDLAILRTAFEARDFSRLIRSGQLLFITTDDKATLFDKLDPHMSLMSMGIDRVIHPPSKQRNESFFTTVEANLQLFDQFVQSNVATLVTNGRKTAENIALNIRHYASSKGLAPLKNLHAKKPAIIVSAGPSLRKNKHLLKDIQDRAVIVAVQTTLQPLLEMGVEPHYVTSLDYHEICSRFFEKLPPQLSTHLIAEPKATPAVFDLHPGPVSLCGNDFAEGLLRELNLHREKIPAGSTVAHLAYYLAEHLGCDPIIFIGQDLGFSDGLCYSPGTSYEDVWRPEISRFCSLEMKQWEHIARDRNVLAKTLDHQGRPMYTEKRLLTYLHQFEKSFATTTRTIIDATEGGAFKRGTQIMPLRDAIEKFCETTPPLPVLGERAGLSRAQSRGVKADEPVAHSAIQKSLETRRSESQQIETIARQTLPLLQEIHDHIDDQPRVNRAIAKIDHLRAQMNELGPCYDLVTQLSQSTELTRFCEDRKIKAAKVEGSELQRRQVKRDIDNVKAILQAAQDFVALMDRAIAQLNEGSMQ